MAWTPQNLTDPKFVQTQLSPLDRGNALLTMTQNLTRVQSKLAENKAALDQVQNQTNGPYSFGTVRDARRAAQEAQAAGASNAAALNAAYEELNAKRQDLNARADTLLRAVQSGEEAIQTSQIAISNLEAAGAVPPGTNQFTPPPGYDSTINPPQQVPDSSIPSTTPSTNAASDDANASPQSVIDPNSDPNTNIGNDSQEQLPQPQQTISLASDPNTNIGAEGQTVTSPSSITENVFDPRQEVTENVFDPRQEVQESVFDPSAGGASGALNGARSTATNQDAKSFEKAKDWRVRLSLAPSAKYLYKADNPGILKPLQATNGVIFPYTPTVSAVYAANYDASELVHSNYKIYNYKNSNVDTVTITGDFTAQDTTEANYLLAVIHFFKSVTKMFYGQDQNPRNGTPPPLVYMSGMGTFQFDNHPLAVTNFTYSLPNEVDYIRAGSVTTEPGSSTAGQTPVNNTDSASAARIQSSNLGPKNPNFQRQQATINSNATYVPTKMQIVITCIPIVTRNDISNNFSLRDYATGALLQGSKRNGGGIW
jgi:hypothetical protein